MKNLIIFIQPQVTLSNCGCRVWTLLKLFCWWFSGPSVCLAEESSNVWVTYIFVSFIQICFLEFANMAACGYNHHMAFWGSANANMMENNQWSTVNLFSLAIFLKLKGISHFGLCLRTLYKHYLWCRQLKNTSTSFSFQLSLHIFWALLHRIRSCSELWFSGRYADFPDVPIRSALSHTKLHLWLTRASFHSKRVRFPTFIQWAGVPITLNINAKLCITNPFKLVTQKCGIIFYFYLFTYSAAASASITDW